MPLSRPTAVYATAASAAVLSASAFSKVSRRSQPPPRADAGERLPYPQLAARDPSVALARHQQPRSGSASKDFAPPQVDGHAPAPTPPRAGFALDHPAAPALPAERSEGFSEAKKGGGPRSAAEVEEELGRLYGMHLNSLIQIQAQLQRVRGGQVSWHNLHAQLAGSARSP